VRVDSGLPDCEHQRADFYTGFNFMVQPFGGCIRSILQSMVSCALRLVWVGRPIWYRMLTSAWVVAFKVMNIVFGGTCRLKNVSESLEFCGFCVWSLAGVMQAPPVSAMRSHTHTHIHTLPGHMHQSLCVDELMVGGPVLQVLGCVYLATHRSTIRAVSKHSFALVDPFDHGREWASLELACDDVFFECVRSL